MTDAYTDHDDYRDEDEFEDFGEDDVDAEEWQEGQCDNCAGTTPQDQAASMATGAYLMPVCACAVGQGASAEECRCG